jgi:hypothetical protein
LTDDTATEAGDVRANRDEIAPERLKVSRVLRLIVGETLFVNVVSLFDAFDDAEEVVGIDILGVEDDDDAPDDGVHLGPVHALDVAQRPLNMPGDMRLARPTDSPNLDVRPSVAGPDAAVAPTRVYPIKGGAKRGSDGIAQGSGDSSGRSADGAEHPQGIHRKPTETGQVGCSWRLRPADLSDGRLDQPAELRRQLKPFDCAVFGRACTDPADQSHDRQLERNGRQLKKQSLQEYFHRSPPIRPTLLLHLRR